MNEFNNEKEKGKNVYKILFIVVFVILIGLIGYLTFTRVLNSKKLFGKEETKEVQEQKENDKKEDSNKEDEIAIPAVKKDIVQKINSLLKQFNQDETSYNANAYGFADYLLKNLELSDAQKQEIALKQAEKVKINIPKDKINIKEIQSEYDMIMEDYKNLAILEYYQVSSEEVEKNYKDLFNSEITHKNTDSSVHPVCPMFFYDKENKVYYASSQCGGINNSQYPIYIDNVYINNDEAYANVYVGFIEDTQSNCINGVCTGTTTFNLYNGIDKTNLIKEIKEVNEVQKYLITNNTKDQFSEYKFTFKQDNNKNYYFEKIEKVK